MQKSGNLLDPKHQNGYPVVLSVVNKPPALFICSASALFSGFEKSDKGIDTRNSNAFIRIVQVDNEGTRFYSNVIKVIPY